MSEFEEAVVKHVLDRLIAEIDKGDTTLVWYTDYNSDGSSNTRSREVNVQHTIVSKVIERLTKDSRTMERLQDRLETIIGSGEFIEKVAEAAAANLIAWLKQEGTWLDKQKYPNREPFKKEVRARVVKIIAQRQADKLLSEDPNP